jgi:general stress protein 26
MATQTPEITPQHQQFINAQKIFFVATAVEEGRINLSPKGMDSLRIIDTNRVIWLNVTGSGNETAAHVQQNPRMTLLFTSFEQEPLILRLYGQARVIHHNDRDWNTLYTQFQPLPGARQIFELSIDMVQSSCGMSVPFYDYVGEREQLNKGIEKLGEQKLKQYWRNKNSTSIDGLPTHIVEKNLEPNP